MNSNWLRLIVVDIEKSQHGSDGVSTWAKLDGCTYKHCFLLCAIVYPLCNVW